MGITQTLLEKKEYMKKLFLSFILLSVTWSVKADELSILRIGEIKMSKIRVSEEREFELPVFSTFIAGKQGDVILDTAAYPSMLTSDFAQSIKLYEKKLFDPSKNLVIFSDLKMPFKLGSATIYLYQAAVLQKPDPTFQRNNIVGLFNPHTIECKDCLIVLDFINKEFYIAQSGSPNKVLAAMDRRYSNMRRISANYVPETEEETNMVRISGISVDNRPQDIVLLDTGTNGTSFLKNSLRNVSIVKKTHIMDAVSDIKAAEITAPLSISLNGIELAKIPVWVEETLEFATNDDNPLRLDRRGDIGMDVMKNCIVALEHKKAVHFYCKPALH